MRKVLLYMMGLIIAGIVAYFAGYQLYEASHFQTEFKEQQFLQKSSSKDVSHIEFPYYIIKIENENLMIYLMPA